MNKMDSRLKFTEQNVERLYRSLDELFDFEPLEKPNVVVRRSDVDDPDGHIVDIDEWTCTCEDSEYNLGEGEICKHRWFILLKRAGLI